MKRILALTCLALALSGTAQARPTIRVPSSYSRVTRVLGHWLFTFWASLRMLPTDGGGTIPPPH